ncbi:MAG: hypothetical protein ACC661_00420 [Verrucomicrobiales bacterium]
MKDKQMACIFLGLLVAVMAFGLQKMRMKTSAMEATAAEAKETAIAAEFERKTVENEIAELKKGTVTLRDYFETWLPYLGSRWNKEQEEQRIIDLVKTGQIFATSQRTEIVPTKGGGFIAERLRAHFMIQDDYTKSMNWLGRLEESLPSSRIETFRLTRGTSGNDVQMEIVLDVPLITTGGGEEDS